MVSSWGVRTLKLQQYLEVTATVQCHVMIMEGGLGGSGSL